MYISHPPIASRPDPRRQKHHEGHRQSAYALEEEPEDPSERRLEALLKRTLGGVERRLAGRINARCASFQHTPCDSFT